MIYIISFYIIAIVIIHILLFTRATYMSRIVLINSAISCLAVAMLLLTYYFKDNNFIDVIFFYIIMSPIGFYGIFLYYKYSFKNKTNKTNKLAENTKKDNTTAIKDIKVLNNKENHSFENKNIAGNINNDYKKKTEENKQKHSSMLKNNFKKIDMNKHKKNVNNQQKNKL